MPLLTETKNGLYCEAGDFYVDPWNPVPRAVVTHAHADHARWGCEAYLAAKTGEHIFRMRLGDKADFQFVDFGENVSMNGVKVSLHPAGHMTGSSQIRIEHQGEVIVASGDYKLETDATCESFEPVKCHTFITESTFGLPIYRWQNPDEVFEDINAWWRENQANGRASVLFGYTVGKAQRLLVRCRRVDRANLWTRSDIEGLRGVSQMRRCVAGTWQCHGSRKRIRLVAGFGRRSTECARVDLAPQVRQRLNGDGQWLDEDSRRPSAAGC